jgi:hypothetical protein
MRTTTLKSILVAVAAIGTLAGTFAQNGGGYDVNWFTISGGGGTSTGGVYAVSATIGQPDAGQAMSGGNYSLTGGFWSVFEPERPAPTLRLVRSNAELILSWEPATPGFALEMTGSLSPALWVPAASGSTNPVVVPATGAARFYRLRRQ